MKWDEGFLPADPLSLRWGQSQVPVRGAGMAAIPEAFRFALDRLAPTIRPTGILSLYANFTGPSRGEESDASVALAVGFLAILKGDRLLQDVTVTGTLTPSGEIGPVTQVAEKAKAAARAGYTLLLVPRGQFYARE
ncbi:MAG: S16 family serine protease [Nitrospiraceae bacterium]